MTLVRLWYDFGNLFYGLFTQGKSILFFLLEKKLIKLNLILRDFRAYSHSSFIDHYQGLRRELTFFRISKRGKCQQV